MKKAIYAGSFDPFTNGHLYVVQQALEIFDELTILVASNPTKKYLFTGEERLSMVKQSVLEMGFGKDSRGAAKFVLLPDGGITVEYAKKQEIDNFVRGMRDSIDMIQERGLYNYQMEKNPDAKHWYIMPPDEMLKVSSTYMKLFAATNDWDIIAKYVPFPVLNYWKEKVDETYH